MSGGPRFLYLHGFASGPSSSKGVAVAAHFAARGVAVERLDLRRPSLEHLRVSEGMKTVRDAIGGPSERVVIMGSSLGGLTAARVAEIDARVAALLLLAPAFRILARWRKRLGEAQWSAWERDGALAIDDYVTKRRTSVDFEFTRDLAMVDAPNDGWPDLRVPTWIIHGRGDETVPIENSRAFVKDKRHARLIEVDDGHELVASLPRILNEADAFFASFFG